MSMQEVLYAGARLAFMGAGVLLVASVWYAIVRDVSGIRDDLSGRRRQRGIDEDVRRAKRGATGARRMEMARVAQDEQSAVTEVFAPMVAPDAPTLVDEEAYVPVHPTDVILRHETIVCGTSDALEEGGA